ncbi:MAG: response regulator [Pseudomonadota bacterium]|nr:response regulator [Pseudomonadota bacterium]
MFQVDRDVVNSHALVIDGNPMSRSVMSQHLRDFGFGSVKAVSRVIEAREIMERRRFDVVICDLHFDHSNESGQELLEELRREQMLPYSTVFIMVTGEATYQKVAEAAEAALDSYLIKPFSANTLFDRLKEARQRKRVLKDIFDAIEAGDNDHAATLCLQRFEVRGQYWLYAARIGAELLLTLQRNDEAMALYNAVVEAKAVPWAKLGLGRVHLAKGDLQQARRTLETLCEDQPQYADSYDVLAKVQMEQGNIDQALATYRMAAEITPGCILRLQHCGTLAFYGGDAATGIKMLDRTWAIGSRSRLFDVLSMMLLAFLRFDAVDSKALGVTCEVLFKFSSSFPGSLRLRRMAETGRILAGLRAGQVAPNVHLARGLVAQINQPEMDMEGATNLLSLWSRLDEFGVEKDELKDVVTRVAKRYSASKAATQVLAAAVRRQPEAPGWIRNAQAEIMAIAEKAMNEALKGSPTEAVELLLLYGAETGNAKLIDMASAVAQRHGDRIDNVDVLRHKAKDLAKRYCGVVSHIAGVRRSNRSAGSLALRQTTPAAGPAVNQPAGAGAASAAMPMAAAVA